MAAKTLRTESKYTPVFQLRVFLLISDYSPAPLLQIFLIESSQLFHRPSDRLRLGQQHICQMESIKAQYQSHAGEIKLIGKRLAGIGAEKDPEVLLKFLSMAVLGIVESFLLEQLSSNTEQIARQVGELLERNIAFA